MSKDAGKKGCRDPAIKLFGTTIAVPTDLMKTGYDSFQTPSGTAEKSPPSSQDGNTSGKKETEELRVLVSTGNQHLSASAILLERESHQSMDQGTDLQGPGMTSSVNFDANMVPLRRRRVELDFSYVVEPQERSCRRSGKVVACPRCDSMDTKFCYYNNYNVNQPRHFCKNCQRYWTAGGTLRNVPIGAGRRKNKSGVPVTPRNLISENGSVRADATDSALPCGLTPAFGMKPNCSSSDIYFQCGKRLGIPALVPCMWPESGASIVGNWIKDTVTGRGSVCRDELVQLSLKLKSGADSISTPGKYRPNLQGDPSAEGTSKSPSVLCGECSDWTASSRFSGSWSHGYDIDWNREMVSPLGGSVFVPNSPKLDPMVENSINEEKAHKTMSVRPGSWTTMSWVNIWCMPEWPVGDAFYPCPFSISPWGKHFLEGRHMESKGVSCAPSTDDLGCNYYPCMWSSPKSQAANPSALPNVFHQKTEIMEQGLGGQNRHTNPAALTRSMVFHEFN